MSEQKQNTHINSGKLNHDHDKIYEFFMQGGKVAQAKDLFLGVSAKVFWRAHREAKHMVKANALHDDSLFMRRIKQLAEIGSLDRSITLTMLEEDSRGLFGEIDFKIFVRLIKMCADRYRDKNFAVIRSVYDKRDLSTTFIENLRNLAENGYYPDEIARELEIDLPCVYRTAAALYIPLEKRYLKSDPIDESYARPWNSYKSIFFENEECFNVLFNAFKDRGYTIHAP